MELGFAHSPPVVWLGLLTSISPCPMATDIAAATYAVFLKPYCWGEFFPHIQ